MIDTREWPTVLLAERQHLPQASAVYVAIDKADIVLYVGASRDIQRRWKFHEKLQAFTARGCLKIAWYLCPIETLGALEEETIHNLNPLMNIRGKQTMYVWEEFSGTAIDPAIGLRVLALRRAKGWKQEELVRMAGVSIGVISRLERGKQSVSAERLDDIARALGVTPDVLFGYQDTRSF